MLNILLATIYAYQLYTAAMMIFTERRQPERSLGWLVVLLFIPVVGLGLFVAFGERMRTGRHLFREAIRESVQSQRGEMDETRVRRIVDDELSKLPPATTSMTADRVMELMTLLFRNNHAMARPFNRLELLSEPKQTFESMWNALETATDHIHVEFFIIDDDSTGRHLKDILCRKARMGIRVRVIYDYWGSRISRKYLKELRAANVYVHAFFPPRFPFLLRHVNNRNHRKIIVIDGKTAFTGGLNVADRYRLGNSLGTWRDTMVRLQGPAVESLQEVFLADWFFLEHKPHLRQRYFPALEEFPDNRNVVQIVDSGPDTSYRSIMQGMIAMLHLATSYVYLQSPYFMPTSELQEALIMTALRGVNVRLLLPKASDTSMAQSGNASYLQPMLDAGVKVYWYVGGFLHSKTMVVDDFISTVGTSNMDFRSYEQNFEVNAFIYDRKTACDLKEAFLRDLSSSIEITSEQWANRSKRQRFIEGISRLFSPAM